MVMHWRDGVREGCLEWMKGRIKGGMWSGRDRLCWANGGEKRAS